MKKRTLIKHIGTGLYLGGVTGGITGGVITLYKCLAKHIIHFSEQGYHHFQEQPLWLIPAAVALFGLAVLLTLVYRKTTNLRGGGIPTAIGVLRGALPFRWLRNAIGILTLSLTTFLVGVPLGNEGPSVQLGTALGKGATTVMGKRGKPWGRYGMTGGACAGFATATGAPLCGILFAVEEAHHKVSPLLLVIAAAAVSTARLVSDLLSPVLGVSSTLFPPLELPQLTTADAWIPVVVGVVMGLFAVLFLNFYRGMSHLMNRTLARVPEQYKIFTVLLLTLGVGTLSYSCISTVHELILSLFTGRIALTLLLVLLLVRTTLTVGANVASLTGGIFLPLLAIGAVLSGVLTSAGQALGMDPAYSPVILVLGITATIAGMMKMPLTAVAFAVEVLSGAPLILPVLLTVALAYGITELFGAESVNDRVLEHRLKHARAGRESITQETTVTVGAGSFAEGKEIRDIFWPDGLFVLSVDKHRALGSKTLQAGDRLHVRYATYNKTRLWQELTTLVGDKTSQPNPTDDETSSEVTTTHNA